MVKLNYKTNNSRWGIRGIEFKDWKGYSFTLGYLSNLEHYNNVYRPSLISIHIEANDEQGARTKEGRIHYYDTLNHLEDTFKDIFNTLDDCTSSGNGKITRRINSNGYVKSLIEDYDFVVIKRKKGKTKDVFPMSEVEIIKNKLKGYLEENDCEENEIEECLVKFDDGYDKPVNDSKSKINNNDIKLTQEDEEFAEGKEYVAKHIRRERNQHLIKLAKIKFKNEHDGKLYCEACGFDFGAKYGKLGDGFIEAHHTKPVSEMAEGEKTKLEDIAMLCSNCHSMIHRKKPWLRKEELKKLIKS